MPIIAVTTSCKEQECLKAGLISIFIFGLVCSFLDIKGWGIFACIAIPTIVWSTQWIRQSLNNAVDNIEKIVQKIKDSLDSTDSLDEVT